jgi:anti-sigma factor RsiW
MNDKQIMAYFLEELPEEESAQIEERCFNDEEYAEQVFAVENELVDDYLCGKLTAENRARFEQRYLTTPGRREGLAIADLMQRYFRETTSSLGNGSSQPARWLRSGRIHIWKQLPGAVRWVGATGLIIAFSAGLWWFFIVRPNRSVSTVPQPQPPLAASVNPSPAQPLVLPTLAVDANSAVGSSPSLATFILSPGATRNSASKGNLLTVPANTERIQLVLLIETNRFAGYSGRLQNIEDGPAYTLPNLKARRNQRDEIEVVFVVSAQLLKSGDYILALSGVKDKNVEETVANYSFRIARKTVVLQK